MVPIKEIPSRSRSQALTFRGAHSRPSSPAMARTGSLACSGARRHPAPRSWLLRCSTPTRRAAPSPTGWSTECLLASPAWRLCRPAWQKGSTTSAGAATAALARRGAQRITTTSWSLRWTPGWVWQPERRDPIWSHASPVTCSARANWSRPTSALDRLPASASEPKPPADKGPANTTPAGATPSPEPLRDLSTAKVSGAPVGLWELLAVLPCTRNEDYLPRWKRSLRSRPVWGDTDRLQVDALHQRPQSHRRCGPHDVGAVLRV